MKKDAAINETGCIFYGATPKGVHSAGAPSVASAVDGDDVNGLFQGKGKAAEMITDLNALEKQGWLRRFTASEPRLGEAVQTYRELGLEVLLVPILDFCKSEGDTDEAGKTSCTACFEADGDPGRHKVIFTRPLKGGDSDDKLF